MLPVEVAAKACICSNTQAVAAPMPRTGSVWLDAVCLVPNWVSRWIVAWIRSGSIWRSRHAGMVGPRRWGNGTGADRCGTGRGARVTRGAVTAVAAEADRNGGGLGLLSL